MSARIAAIVFFFLSLSAAAQPPALFFSDLTSGPNMGGEGNNGVYVTVYGNFLGPSQGSSTITAGGGLMTNCRQWGVPWLMLPSGQNWIQKITCQLGPAAGSGNIVVTVNGQVSNGLPFTVRPGNIYFVSASGSDGNDGSFASPWRTIPHAAQTAGANAGSTIYAMNGVSAAAEDGQGWDAALTLRNEWCKGSSSAPVALLAYPGATVTIGTTGQSPGRGIRSTDFSADGGACAGNWIFGGIRFIGPDPVEINGPSDNWRMAGLDVSNPQQQGGEGGGAAWETSLATHVRLLGSRMHDLNLATTDRLYQGVYLSTDSNHSELGWNLIFNVKGRAGIQTHSSPVSSGNGYAMYDLSIHDNIVHDIAEECIIVDTVDPSKGPVTVYNNIVYNCGQDNNANGAIYRAVSSDFDTSHGVGSGTVDVHNNTIVYPFLPAGYASSFEVHEGQLLVDLVRNNLIYAAASASYWDPWTSGRGNNSRECGNADTPSACPNFSGSNNLVYNAGPPAFANLLANNVNANPNFVDLAKHDFHLQANSPAAGAGMPLSNLTHDIEGKIRSGSNPSIGAFEGALAPGSAPSNPVPAAAFRDQAGAIHLTEPGSANLWDAGGALVSDPSIAQDLAGNSYVVGRDSDGSIWMNVFSAANRSWNGWTGAGGIMAGQPAVAVAPSGAAYVAVRDNWGACWLANFQNAAFGPWIPLNGVFASDVSIAAALDGSIYIVGRDTSGGVWIGHYVPGSGFQGYTFLGGVIQGRPAITAGSDGAVYIAARDTSGSVWMTRVQGNATSQWSPGGGMFQADPSIADSNGVVYVLGIDSLGSVFYNQVVEGTALGWAGWTWEPGTLMDGSIGISGGNVVIAGRNSSDQLWWFSLSSASWTQVTGYQNIAAGPLMAAPH